MAPVYEHGILVGWYGQTTLNGEQTRVFIPRRQEDIEADEDRRRRRQSIPRDVLDSLSKS